MVHSRPSGSCYPDNLGQNPNLPRSQKSPTHWYNTSVFVDRLPNSGFRFGNAGRNTIIGPGVIDWDFSLLKEFRVRETHNLELRWEVFNTANHPLFDIPGSTVNATNGGVISATKIDNRQIQLALRYVF